MPSKEHLARILQYVGIEISNSTNELSKTYFNSNQNTLIKSSLILNLLLSLTEKSHQTFNKCLLLYVLYR